MCPTLCGPEDCSLPGSSVHGIFQVRILERVAVPFSRGSPWPKIKPGFPRLQADSLPSEPPGKPIFLTDCVQPWECILLTAPVLVGSVVLVVDSRSSPACITVLRQKQSLSSLVWETSDRESSQRSRLRAGFSFVCLLSCFSGASSSYVVRRIHLSQWISPMERLRCAISQATLQPFLTPDSLEDRHYRHGQSAQGSRLSPCDMIFLGECPGCRSPAGPGFLSERRQISQFCWKESPHAGN